jgi:hypothetical protein
VFAQVEERHSFHRQAEVVPSRVAEFLSETFPILRCLRPEQKLNLPRSQSKASRPPPKPVTDASSPEFPFSARFPPIPAKRELQRELTNDLDSDHRPDPTKRILKDQVNRRRSGVFPQTMLENHP